MSEYKRLTEFWNGSWVLSQKAFKDGYDNYSIYSRLAQYENIGSPEEFAELAKAKAEGRLIKLPCTIGDTVFRLCKCKEIPAQLDGTMYSHDGSPGTATGYYCPYDFNCPHNVDNCEKAKKELAVFEDTVTEITLYGGNCWIHFRNTPGCEVAEFGKIVFLTREEAEAALKIGGEER